MTSLLNPPNTTPTSSGTCVQSEHSTLSNLRLEILSKLMACQNSISPATLLNCIGLVIEQDLNHTIMNVLQNRALAEILQTYIYGGFGKITYGGVFRAFIDFVNKFNLSRSPNGPLEFKHPLQCNDQVHTPNMLHLAKELLKKSKLYNDSISPMTLFNCVGLFFEREKKYTSAFMDFNRHLGRCILDYIDSVDNKISYVGLLEVFLDVTHAFNFTVVDSTVCSKKRTRAAAAAAYTSRISGIKRACTKLLLLSSSSSSPSSTKRKLYPLVKKPSVIDLDPVSDDEIPPTEEVCDKEMIPNTEKVSGDEIPPTEKVCDHEIPTTEKVSDDEIPPTEKVCDHEIPPTEKVSGDEIPPTEKVGDHEIPPTEKVSGDEIPPAFGIIEDNNVKPVQYGMSLEDYKHALSLEETATQDHHLHDDLDAEVDNQYQYGELDMDFFDPPTTPPPSVSTHHHHPGDHDSDFTDGTPCSALDDMDEMPTDLVRHRTSANPQDYAKKRRQQVTPNLNLTSYQKAYLDFTAPGLQAIPCAKRIVELIEKEARGDRKFRRLFRSRVYRHALTLDRTDLMYKILNHMPVDLDIDPSTMRAWAELRATAIISKFRMFHMTANGYVTPAAPAPSSPSEQSLL